MGASAATRFETADDDALQGHRRMVPAHTPREKKKQHEKHNVHARQFPVLFLKYL